MPDSYLGQIILFSGKFVIEGWMPCDGRLISVQSNQALYSILGNMYGGDGVRNFALPDLRGAVPVGVNHNQGSDGPVQEVGAKGGVIQVENVAMNEVQGGLKGTIPQASSTGKIEVKTPALTNLPPSVSLRYLICVSGGDYPPQAEY